MWMAKSGDQPVQPESFEPKSGNSMRELSCIGSSSRGLMAVLDLSCIACEINHPLVPMSSATSNYLGLAI